MPESKYTIIPTEFQREDKMTAIRLPNGMWAIRAPIQGQTRFWNGQVWVFASFIAQERPGTMPFEFQFSEQDVPNLLQTLEAP